MSLVDRGLVTETNRLFENPGFHYGMAGVGHAVPARLRGATGYAEQSCPFARQSVAGNGITASLRYRNLQHRL